MLPLTDPAHHSFGPKDLSLDPEKKAVMSMDIARTTNHTGEQLHLSVPIYHDDTRVLVEQRLGFAYSLIQDRMEQENKAMEFAQSRNETIRRAVAVISKNETHLKHELEKANKLARQGKLTKTAFEAKREKLMKDLDQVNSETLRLKHHAEAEISAGKELPSAAL